MDRKRLLDIIHELSLAKTKFFNPDAAPRTGYLVGVHYILEGLYWEPGSLPAGDAIRAELEKRTANRRERFDAHRQAVLYINAYEVETGQVKAVAYGADVNPAVCARKAVEDLLAQFTDDEIYIKVTSVDPQTGTAILDIGSADDVKVGCLFAIETASEDGSPGEPVTAKVEQVDLLSCTCRLQGESKDAVQEGAPAHRAEPSGD